MGEVQILLGTDLVLPHELHECLCARHGQFLVGREEAQRSEGMGLRLLRYGGGSRTLGFGLAIGPDAAFLEWCWWR